MLSDFHFLRPLWLLVIPAAVLLFWLNGHRQAERARFGGVIAPHLLAHLLTTTGARQRFRPIHALLLLLVLASLAAAGPTVDRESPPFARETAPLAIAVDLTGTMDAVDVTPTRLERAKLKIQDLLALRSGAPTALYAYGSSAHLVLPPTDDPELIRTYAQALATRLIPPGQRNTSAALHLIEDAFSRTGVNGTILFLTDGIEPEATATLKGRNRANTILVLAIGTEAGGPVRGGADYALDASGRVERARLDIEGLQRLRDETGIELTTVTADASDIDWVERLAASQPAEAGNDTGLRWRDLGWWLTFPIVLLAALSFRKGWTVQWCIAALAINMAIPGPALAVDWLHPWSSADQQGQRAYNAGDYVGASQRFDNPMWKGVAAYRAGDFSAAIDAFTRVDTPEADFNRGNALARADKLEQSAASYREALSTRPDWAEAKANLAIVTALIAARNADKKQENADPNEQPDSVQFDNEGKEGKRGPISVAQQSADIWMRNIQISPADLLARKFALEVHRPSR
ncbi:hypothetical protein LA66_13905 [Aureimonas altamirensis]|uniref:VWFA domain-containing protein n=2 Tax=Aureimonas altamirensis TaxID=370622 RepID=A0A0B1Q569_9HYPH|nr:hypothetical protein LA66_13905 [Aureimonas altamirensis]